MMRFILLIYLTASVATAPVSAHPEKDAPATGVEIGTLFGLSRFPSDEATVIGVPGLLVLSLIAAPTSSLYVLWFPSEHEQLAIGSEFSFGMSEINFGMSEYDEVIASLHLGGRGTFFLRNNSVSGPYLLGIGALISLYEGNRNFSSSKHVFSASGGLGYQWRVGPAFVLRTEGRYRRWIDDGENEFSLFLGLGTRLGGK